MMDETRHLELDLSRVGVIVPALNEEEPLRILLPALRSLGVGQIIVGNNGSTDSTAEVARENGADVADAPVRGYGMACEAAMQLLGPHIHCVVFMDADMSIRAEHLPTLVAPLLDCDVDFILAARPAHLREPGAMTPPQRFGTWLATVLIRIGWGYPYRDMGPFRAIRRECLDRIDMQDRAFGWTVEMQVRAVELNLRIAEIDLPYHARVGKSKISGTVKGVFLAGYWILKTVGSLWLTKRSRLRR